MTAICATRIRAEVRNALNEDIGAGDITAALLPAQTCARATVISRQSAIVCGRAWVNEVFQQLDRSIRCQWFVNDGDAVTTDQALCSIEGSARALLTGERTALNFLQTLSATATATRRFVDIIEGSNTRLLDTRKTIPGLRYAQKYAVQCGGGINHRFGLFDAFLIKENHIIAAGGIASACAKARSVHPHKLLEVEVESIEELNQALAANVDRVMLDNFNLATMREAVALNQKQAELEVSGNIDENTLSAIAQTGVDYISVGALTKNIAAVDLSMRFDA